MTTTVHVQARAHGAVVTITTAAAEGDVAVNTEEAKIDSWEEKTFHLEPGQSLAVTQGTAEMVDPSLKTDTATDPVINNDQDKDGHDDTTGAFVRGNQEGKRRGIVPPARTEDPIS